MITDKTKKNKHSKFRTSSFSFFTPTPSYECCRLLGVGSGRRVSEKIELETSVKMSQTIEKPSDHRISIVAATSVAGANTTLCQL